MKDLTPQRWQEIDRIFAAALDHEPAERAAFLAEACGDDELLQKEVESLLTNDIPVSLVGDHAVEEATRLLEIGLRTGEKIGAYEIIRSLGAGGMGHVYLAHDERLKRRVAVKLLSPYHGDEKERIRRFRREAFAASALNHPNILTVYEIGSFAGKDFIATEYVDGMTLRTRIQDRDLPVAGALEIAKQIASALSAAHQAGIVHRDIKPDNVMVRADGLVKVLDFGIAKTIQLNPEVPAQESQLQTTPGTVVGTAAYMSPEQARGLAVDARTDVWSLGVVLYEIVSGRRPFAGDTLPDVMAAVLERQPPPLSQGKVVPESLERIVSKALEKKTTDRYQTAAELLADLKELTKKLESSEQLTPDSRSQSAAVEKERPGSGARASSSGLSQVVSGYEPASLSSKEYIVGRVKHPKFAVMATVAALMIAAVAGVYFYFARANRKTIDSVAVLPFVNANNNSDTEYLSDGISGSLINNLSQLPQLKIIAQSSTFKYKSKEIDPQEVANALGVQAIVTGRIARLGDNLQISVELVNARDKTQIWGEQYTRNAADLQAVQGEIARTILEKLRVKLTGAQDQQITKHATENPEAYQLFLNGQFFRRKGRIQDERKAFDYYNRAIALDPNFAQAYVGLADEYHLVANGSLSDPKDALARAKEALRKALELDDTLAQAHAGLGRLKINEWDWAGAEIEFKRALELNPNLERVHSQYSYYLSDMGRHTEALAEIRRAQELDPLNMYTKSDEGLALHNAHRFDEAVRQLQHVIELQPDFSFARFVLGTSYAMKGMYPEAIVEYQKFSNLEGETTEEQIYLGYAYAMSGQRDRALAILNKLKTTKEYVSPAELAILYTGLGDREGAFRALERAHAAHDLQMQYLKVEPHYDSLRSDSRFTDLMRRIGLPQGS